MKSPKPISQMTKEELVEHLKIEYAAEDYFTGVLGNRNSVILSKPVRRKAVNKGKARVSA